MNDNNRRFFSPEQKVAILREHLVEGKAVSDLCERHRLHPTVFYQWQRQFFENGTAAFESKQSRSQVSDGYQKKIETLEQKLQRKNEVLSELLEEHTRLKKNLGRPECPLGGTRHSRRDHGLHRTLVGTHPADSWLDWFEPEQVLLLA
jgi:transposase